MSIWNPPWPITSHPPFLFHNIFTGFVAGVAQWVPLVTLGLPTLLKQINSSPVFSRVHFAQYLVFCLMFCWPLVDFCPLSLGIVYYLPLELQLPVTPFGIYKLFSLKFKITCFFYTTKMTEAKIQQQKLNFVT
jgi:hypothetical protein